MSTNGRRAWRKWCKRARLRMNKHHRALYRGAIMRKKQPERTPVPVKQFTDRSLVGMSESAKRRAARARFVELVLASQGTEIKPDDQGPRWFHLWCRGYGDVARAPDYAAMRSQYRIGERLRPCPGCFDCSVECWVCHEPHEPSDELCGGSGVIRAGRLRAALRRPDCGFYVA